MKKLDVEVVNAIRNQDVFKYAGPIQVDMDSKQGGNAKITFEIPIERTVDYLREQENIPDEHKRRS